MRHASTPPTCVPVPSASRAHIARVQRVDVDGSFLQMVTVEEDRSRAGSQDAFTLPARAVVPVAIFGRFMRVQRAEAPGSFLEMVTLEEDRGHMSSQYPFMGESQITNHVYRME
jgi:hypothetical protein